MLLKIHKMFLLYTYLLNLYVIFYKKLLLLFVLKSEEAAFFDLSISLEEHGLLLDPVAIDSLFNVFTTLLQRIFSVHLIA